MALLKPFRGYRPPAELAPRVAAPPYDVVSTEEARAYAKGNDESFFHVSRPEIDFPPGIDEHSEDVYQRGLSNFRAFIARGWLQQDAAPRFYAYRQVMGAHAQVGLVAAASVDEYDRGLIKKHELTRADKEDDRARHIEVLGANDEPVFLTYQADRAIDGLMERATRSAADVDFTSDDGIRHTLWCLSDEATQALERAFRAVPHLYIADGHHRSAAASRVHKLYRDRAQSHPGHDAFLAVIFPHDQMQILDYNRVVRDLNGLSPEAFLEQVKARFALEPTQAKKPTEPRTFGMYLGGRWYRLKAKPGSYPSTPVGQLDVSILQAQLLAPVLGIADPRKDPRISFVGGIRGVAELEKLVDSGAFQVAFSMFPTRMEELMAIADAGEIMPPKSTWFEPKLRSGLVVHCF